MTRYAENTNVSEEKSRAEIEQTLRRYGSPNDGFAYGRKGRRTYMEFEFKGRNFRLIIELPDPKDEEFWISPSGRQRRSEVQAEAAWEQSCRQCWRALSLVIKAKLEAVEAGIATFEDEFLAYQVLPDGKTVGQCIHPQITNALAAGKQSALLMRFGGPEADSG